MGKSGLLAQAVIRTASTSNYEVFTISRSQGFDLTRTDAGLVLEEAFKSIAPALIFNAVGITNLEECERNPIQAWILNVRLPALIAGLANQNKCPWVHISTDHFFNGDENLLHSENETPKPPNEYALSKLAGEAISLSSPTAFVIRTNIIGKRGWADQPNFAEWAINCLNEHAPFDAYTDTWASSIEVNQFAKLALKLAESGQTGLMNLACSVSISKADLIKKIAVQSGLSTKYLKEIKTPAAAFGRPRRANAMGLDCTKAQKCLYAMGLSLPDADEVVSALIQSFSE